MKNLLTKTLFISLFLSTAIPSAMQANFDFVTLKNRQVIIKKKMANWLSKTGKNYYNALKKHPITTKTSVQINTVQREIKSYITFYGVFREIYSALRKKGVGFWESTQQAKQAATWITTEERNISDMQQFLIRMNPNNQKRDWKGAPLILAAKEGYFPLVELFANNKAEINKQDWCGQTALMFVAKWGHLKTAKLLLAKGADINKQSSADFTALMYAAWYGQLAMVKLLVNSGADVTKQDKNGHNTALMWARKKGHLEVAKIFEKLDKK